MTCENASTWNGRRLAFEAGATRGLSPTLPQTANRRLRLLLAVAPWCALAVVSVAVASDTTAPLTPSPIVRRSIKLSPVTAAILGLGVGVALSSAVAAFRGEPPL
jgi:hypothetical protein